MSEAKPFNVQVPAGGQKITIANGKLHVPNQPCLLYTSIDGYLELFENFEHADVRHAARAAAGEHQADTGADRIGRAGGGPIRPRIVSAGAGRPRIRRQRQP